MPIPNVKIYIASKFSKEKERNIATSEVGSSHSDTERYEKQGPRLHAKHNLFDTSI
jgi:hypothetical protein